jgi:hypothetical protein
MLKRKRRSMAFPACVLITQVAVEALRRRIKALKFSRSLPEDMPALLKIKGSGNKAP